MPSGKNLDQGEGGAKRKLSSGSNLDQGRSGGARSGGRSGSHLDPSPQTKKTYKTSGPHTTPRRVEVANKKTPERGGHSRHGHDRVNPSAAKSKSGNHLDQHPSLKKR